jgi:hypothetical protein
MASVQVSIGQVNTSNPHKVLRSFKRASGYKTSAT